MQIIDNPTLKQELIDHSDFADQFSFNAATGAELVKIPARSYIVKESETPTDLFYLVRGKAKLYETLSNGKTVIIGFFTPPCFVGEMELIDPTSAPFSVQAIEDCWCLALPDEQFKGKLLNDTLFLRNLCIYLAQKNSRNIITASQNQAFTLSQRLAAFILLTEHNDTYDEKHTEVAQYLGVSYRHLLYVLAAFVKNGYLKKTTDIYKIINRLELQRLAKEVNNSAER